MKELENMSSRSLSSLVPLALIMFAIGVCALPARGQGFTFQDFNSTNNLALNGTLNGVSTANFPISTGGVGSALRLTTAGGGEAGSAWYKTKQPITGGFTAIFQFQMSAGSTPPADGIAFVIQNAGTAALGLGGGAIGYGGNVNCTGEGGTPPCTDDSSGIPKSLAIEFDSYKNGWDIDANHVAIQSCGAGPNTSDHTNCNIAPQVSLSPSITLATTVGALSLITHTAFIQYVPSAVSCESTPKLTLSMETIDNVILSTCVDLGGLGVLDGSGNAYVGFTAGTGANYENNDILNWEFVTPITESLNGNAATNAFAFPFAQYNVVYPPDVSISNTTMTISVAVLSEPNCNAAINVFGAGNVPACTTFANLYNLPAIFDLTCSVNGAPATSDQCPQTSGFNPFLPGHFHSSEDISNTLVYATNDQSPVAPQFLTAHEGNNDWVPIGVAFQADCCTRGSGTSSYNSLMVAADFPTASSSFAIPPYKFVGFERPVENAGPGEINDVKAGSVIPFKWRLLYPVAPTLGFNGGPVTNLSFFPGGTLAITAMLRSGGPSVIIDDQSNVGLVNQGNGHYLFPWKTTKALAGKTIRVTLSTGDGVNHNADFRFEKPDK